METVTVLLIYYFFLELYNGRFQEELGLFRKARNHLAHVFIFYEIFDKNRQLEFIEPLHFGLEEKRKPGSALRIYFQFMHGLRSITFGDENLVFLLVVKTDI